MQDFNDGCGKRRLVDRSEIRVAIRLLLRRGYASSDMAPILSRYYFVDVDALNEELAALMSEAPTAYHPGLL